MKRKAVQRFEQAVKGQMLSLEESLLSPRLCRSPTEQVPSVAQSTHVSIVDTLSRTVQLAFPYATLAFRPEWSAAYHAGADVRREQKLASRNARSQVAPMAASYLARHEIRRPLNTVATNKERVLCNGAEAGNDHRPDLIRLGADAIVFLGGYSGVDLPVVVAEKLVRALPDVVDSCTFDQEAIRRRWFLESRRIQAYLRSSALEKTLAEKDCQLHCDGLEIRLPEEGDVDGWVEERKNPVLLQSAHRVLLAFGDPGVFPSVLNYSESDLERRQLRPGFGFSEHRLQTRLPRAWVAAASALHRCAARWVGDPVKIPPKVFWFSCLGHLSQDPEVTAACLAEVSQGGDAVIAEAVLQRIQSPEMATLSTNFFLEVESFHSLSWWRHLHKHRREFPQTLCC